MLRGKDAFPLGAVLGTVPRRKPGSSLIFFLAPGLGFHRSVTSMGALRRGSRLLAQPLIGRIPQQRPPRSFLTLRPRSEEHTSELQSLMRISYAVFCLKNKTHII